MRILAWMAVVLALFTAGCGGDDSVGINQPYPVVNGVTLSPANATITPGQQLQFAANTSAGDQAGQSTWTSSNSAIASISNSGLATGLAPGTVTITATVPGGVLGSTTLTVGAPAVTGLSISPNPIQLALNTRRQLAATATFLNGANQDVTTQVNWSTGNPAVAQVSTTGELIAVGPGQTTVTATQGSTLATAVATVSSASLQSVSFSPAVSSLRVGQQIQLTATGTFSDGSVQDITNSASWTSSNPNVAGVSNVVPKGLLNGASPGPATIQASIGEVGASFGVTVTP